MGKEMDLLKKKALKCLECPICSRARKNQSGLAYLFTKYIDRKLCPNCKAFEKVTGQLAYEPLSEAAKEKLLS